MTQRVRRAERLRRQRERRRALPPLEVRRAGCGHYVVTLHRPMADIVRDIVNDMKREVADG